MNMKGVIAMVCRCEMDLQGISGDDKPYLCKSSSIRKISQSDELKKAGTLSTFGYFVLNIQVLAHLHTVVSRNLESL